MIELLVVGATQLDSPKSEGLSKLMEDLLARSGGVLERPERRRVV